MPYMVWTTTRCNLRCEYCYEGYEKENKNLTIETANQILNYIEKDFAKRKNDELIVEYHGGEPLLNFKVIQYLTEEIEKKYIPLGIKTTFQLTTNATMLDDNIMEFLLMHIQSLTVSLDGTQMSHDKMRKFHSGYGSYEKVMKNSLRMLKKKENIRVRMTVTPENVKDLYENVLHLVNKGFKLIVPVLDVFDRRWNEEMFEVIRKSVRRIKRKVLQNNVVISITDPLIIYRNYKCDGGSSSQNIYPDGNIYPCTMAAGNKEFLIGDIYNGINTEKLKTIMSFSNLSILECQGCSYYNSCNSVRCRIINKLVNGNYLKPEVVECYLNHIIYEENGFKVV